MPVALPPAGEYQVGIANGDAPEARGQSAVLVVEGGGSLRLRPGSSDDPGGRILISFEPAASA